MSGMGSMSMVFTTAHNTPLYSKAWTPTSTGAYAGTCIFLIVLAIISRLLQAWRHTLEQRIHDKAMKRRYVVVAGEQEGEQSLEESEAAKEISEKQGILTSRGLDEKVRIITAASRRKETTPWRITTELPRACVYTVQAGLGYLLMLAVMTLNVGYFLSVLAGLFVGELAIGRYASPVDDHH
ncbi:Ctr copper transporter [Aureobasidium melanogenum CBS 110374]|uniref:Copper transport protein n=2 Tax=Aureobasidium melanogenum TaxID=46634 RepID=A0A074VGC4_AURM1|nr:Ctr copper transporter [Aureobasidium melanogenum CBS 110374]KEQ59800.1 Ctr copper transporter [Aureobasidium melanogenum CBS 110374]